MDTNEKKSSKKLLPIIIGAVAVLAAAGVVLALTLGGKGGSEDTPDNMSDAEKTLHELLAAEGSAEVELTEDVLLTQSLVVNGEKTLKGAFTIKSSAGMEYAITIMDGATLSYNDVILDLTDGAANGIYVSGAAKLDALSGSIANAAGHGIRTLGTTVYKGGSIENMATNWFMADENATLEISGGDFKKAGDIGIITGAGSKLTITESPSFDETGSYTVYAAGDSTVNGGSFANNGGYTFFNGGKMSIEKLALSGAKYLGYIENGAGAAMTVKNVEFKDTNADYVYNQGNISIEDCTFGDSINTAIESKGKDSVLAVKNATFGKIGQNVILLKQGKANLENISAESAGTHFISNKSGQVTGLNLKVGDCGGGALMNEALSDNDLCGNATVDGFECGNCGTYGIRCDGGEVAVKNAVIGKSTSYCLYLKEGAGTFENVEFTGMNVEGRATAMVGYGAYRTAIAQFTGCKFTGGARGFTNHANTTLKDCEIYGNKSSGTIHVGGGINNDGILIMEGCLVHDNQAASSGGGVYNKGEITIKSGNKIYNNKSATSGGGFANSKGTAVVEGGSFYDNYASNYGGGIYNSGSMKFKGGTVSNNNCAKGGGAMENTGTVTLSGGTFKNNRTDSFGGGFYNGKAGTATLCGVTIKNNRNGKDKSGGGIYNLGKCYIKEGTKITGNVADTYGGGVTNGLPSDGSVIPQMTISGGIISDNTAATKGGGGVYNRAQMTISGGTITGNHVSDGQSGKNVYTSGTLNLKGGKITDTEGKPYDVYAYKGEVNLSGSFNIGSMYKAADAKINITGDFSNSFKYFMTTYNLGDYVAHGSTKLIVNNRDKFILPAEKVASNLFINDQGRLDDGESDLNKAEAELIRDGQTVAKGLFTAICGMYQSGDIIQIDEDVTIKDAVALSFVSKTASSAGKSKTVTITDNGKPHTVTIVSPNNAGFYIAANGGDGADGPSETGYYRTYMTVSIIGKGGLTFAGSSAEKMKSALFYVTSNATLNVSGKVTFKDAYNIGTEGSVAADHTAGKYGGAIYVTNSALNIDGAVFENCHNDNSGGAVYLASSGTINIKNTTFTDCFAGANGGAVYLYRNGSDNILTNCKFTDNTAAGNGNAISLSSNESTTTKITLSGVTVKNSIEAGYDVYTSTTSTLALAGKSDISEIYAQNVIKINSVSDGSSIGLTVPTTKYVKGTQVYTGSADALKKAAAATSLTMDPSAEVELAVSENGTLQKYINKCAQLYNASGVLVETETFEKAVADAQDGYSIKLTEDAIISDGAAITVNKNLTIDGCGNAINLGSTNSMTSSADKSLTLKDVTANAVTVNGTVIPAGTVNISNISLAQGAVIKAASTVNTGSSIGVTVPDSQFVVGTQIVEKDASAGDPAFASAISAIVLKNVSKLDLMVAEDGKLDNNNKPNAILRPAEGMPTEGKFVDLLLIAQPEDTIEFIDDFKATSDIVINQDITINGAGKTVTFVSEGTGFVLNEGTLTLAGNFTVSGAADHIGEDADKKSTAAFKIGEDAAIISAKVISEEVPPVVSTPYSITVKGYGQNASGLGTYTSKVIKLDGAVCQANETMYTEFDDAFNDTIASDKAVYVKLLADDTSAGGFVTGNNNDAAGITIDVNGKILTVTGEQFVKIQTLMSIIDSSDEKTGKIIGTADTINSNGFIYNNGISGASGFTLTIKDVTIESAGNYTVNASGFKTANMDIADATIINTAGNNAARVNSSAKLTITGGKYSGGLVTGTSGSSTIMISSGYFTVDVSEYCIEGYECVADTTYADYGYIVKLKPDAIIKAYVGKVGYPELDAALSAVQNDGVITLNPEKFDYAQDIKITTSKKFTLNLGGGTLTGKSESSKIFEVSGAGVDVTLVNGTIKSGKKTVNQVISATTNAKLTLGTGLTVTGCTTTGNAIIGTTAETAIITIDGAAVSGNADKNGRSIYVGNKGTVIIKSGIIDEPVYNYNGTLTVTGGLFAADTAISAGESQKSTVISGGFFTSNSAIGDNAVIKDGYELTNATIEDGVDISKYAYKVALISGDPE